MIDEGHIIPDPIIDPEPPDFTLIGELSFMVRDRLEKLAESHSEVLKDIGIAVAHLARLHDMHQDEIIMLIVSWLNANPGTGPVGVSFSVKY